MYVIDEQRREASVHNHSVNKGIRGAPWPHNSRPPMLAINFALAVVLAIFTGRDLLARGVRLGWIVGLSYIAAPLVGLILYGLFSTARPAEAASAA